MDYIYKYQQVLPHSPHGRSKQQSQIVDADPKFVEKYITRHEFSTLFGGYLITKDVQDLRGTSCYIGVWGNDKIKKFKRTLIDRGAVFEVLEIDGSQRWINQLSN